MKLICGKTTALETEETFAETAVEEGSNADGKSLRELRVETETGMFVLAVLALIAEALITALENRLIKWRPSRVSGEIPI